MTPDGGRPPPLRIADWSEENKSTSGTTKGSREMNYSLGDDGNLGAAFSSLGFASPGMDRRKIPRPRFTKQDLHQNL